MKLQKLKRRFPGEPFVARTAASPSWPRLTSWADEGRCGLSGSYEKGVF